MNRYIIDGIMNDLRAGRLVVLVSPTLKESASIFNLIADAAKEEHLAHRIIWVNGGQRIETVSGGQLIVTAANMRGGRGFNADAIVVHRLKGMDAQQVRDISRYAIVTCAELIDT